MKRVLLTGGAGFIGHHVAQTILRETDWSITFLDRLSFSGNQNRIFETEDWPANAHRCRWVHHDLRGVISPLLSRQIGVHDYILHLAAMTHVDRSIVDPLGAVMDNVVGTTNLLNFARDVGCGRFLYFSTDEVFGPAPGRVAYKEWDRYNSGNPYSAAKAGGEEMALAFHNTYQVPVVVTHTMNVFGERQHPEKFIPSTIRKVLHGDEVLVHADKTRTIPGSRFYIHARNVGASLLFVLKNGVSGDKYNIVGEREVNNLELAHMIADAVGKPLRAKLVDFHSSRPGHDLRYGLDGSRLAEMGWQHPATLDESLKATVDWFLSNPKWLEAEAPARPRLMAAE